MTWLARPPVALGFGAFFLCAEACDHFNNLTALPAHWLSLPFYDWAAGLFLICGAVISRRDWSREYPYQIAAWAFITSLLFGAFLDHLDGWMSSSPDATGTVGLVRIPEGPEIVIIGLLLVFALGGLVSSIKTGRQ